MASNDMKFSEVVRGKEEDTWFSPEIKALLGCSRMPFVVRVNSPFCSSLFPVITVFDLSCGSAVDPTVLRSV